MNRKLVALLIFILVWTSTLYLIEYTVESKHWAMVLFGGLMHVYAAIDDKIKRNI